MIDYFTNDKYKVLKCMAERQIEVKNTHIVKLSQQNIADILQLTKVKVNSIIGELKCDGYIIQHSVRGGYSLTPKANMELEKINNMEVPQ